MSPSHFSLTSSGISEAPLVRNNSSTSKDGPDITVESESLRTDRSRMPPRIVGIGEEGAEGAWEEDVGMIGESDSDELRIPMVKSSPFREPPR
jgi:hypothetical protein